MTPYRTTTPVVPRWRRGITLRALLCLAAGIGVASVTATALWLW